MAIGARSQAARTYLERFLDDLGDCELEELVKHGLRALRDTLPNEVNRYNEHSTRVYEYIFLKNRSIIFEKVNKFVEE